MENVPIEKFGRDHWSTLAYLETRAVDCQGKVDPLRMRSKDSGRGCPPTRLRAHDEQLANHDDYDCLEDMEKAGLLINRGTGSNPVVGLTDRGWKVASCLRRWKAEGGQYSHFPVRMALSGEYYQ